MESLEKQIRQPYEIIVVDDGSEVRPKLWLGSFGSITTAVFAPHRGLGSVLNTAVRLMRGDVLCWLPSDDLWKADKLARQAEFAEEYPGCVLHSFCDLYFEFDGTTTSGIVPNLTDAEFATAIRTSSPYFGNTFWIPKDILNLVGPFREDVPACEEYDWVLRSVVKHGVKYRLQEECLTVKRITGDSTAQRCAADIARLVRQFNEEVDRDTST